MMLAILRVWWRPCKVLNWNTERRINLGIVRRLIRKSRSGSQTHVAMCPPNPHLCMARSPTGSTGVGLKKTPLLPLAVHAWSNGNYLFSGLEEMIGFTSPCVRWHIRPPPTTSNGLVTTQQFWLVIHFVIHLLASRHVSQYNALHEFISQMP